MRTVDRVALVERNDIELARYQSRAPGGSFVQDADATWFALDIPAGRFNCVLSARLAERTADARIEELLEPYRRRGGPYGWMVGPGARPRDLGERLTRHGLPHRFDIRGMAADLRRVALLAPGPSALVIEPVRDEASLREWVSVVGRAFDDPPKESTALLRVESDLGLSEAEPRTLFLG